MVRHLRDPVTGECTVCGPSHGKATPSNKPATGWGIVQVGQLLLKCSTFFTFIPQKIRLPM